MKNLQNNVTINVTLMSQTAYIISTSKVNLLTNKISVNVTPKSPKTSYFCDINVTNIAVTTLIISIINVTLKTIRLALLLSQKLLGQLGQLLTRLVPSSYPLYIKSNNGCLSGLVSLDSPFAAASNHPHAMDRRNHGLNISLTSTISRDIVQNRVTHSFRVTIPYSLSSTKFWSAIRPYSLINKGIRRLREGNSAATKGIRDFTYYIRVAN